MATTEEIRNWFDRGVKQGDKFLIVVVDTFDWEDYPVFAKSAEHCVAKYNQPGEMQQIVEVYDLSMDREEQLNQYRVMNLPTQ